MARRTLIGIIGPGEGADGSALRDAEQAGELAARRGWVVLTGGRSTGVMDAAARGAERAGGMTIGILPGRDHGDASPAVQVAVPTGLGEARNTIIALASDALIVCGMNAGTASEVAFAVKAGRPVVLVRAAAETVAFFRRVGHAGLRCAESPEEAILLIGRELAEP